MLASPSSARVLLRGNSAPDTVVTVVKVVPVHEILSSSSGIRHQASGNFKGGEVTPMKFAEHSLILIPLSRNRYYLRQRRRR